MAIKILLTTGDTVFTTRYTHAEAVNARDTRKTLEVGGNQERLGSREPLRTIFPEAIASIEEI